MACVTSQMVVDPLGKSKKFASLERIFVPNPFFLNFRRFMWFSFTSIGAVAALVIIMSLWEKFQTNPTITGAFVVEWKSLIENCDEMWF